MDHDDDLRGRGPLNTANAHGALKTVYRVHGGHFAAWEQPKIFSEEVRAGFKSLRG